MVIRLSDVCQAHIFSNHVNSQLTLAYDLAELFFRFFHPYLSKPKQEVSREKVKTLVESAPYGEGSS